MMAATNPDISVLIPVYNGEAYLDQCLNSVVNQSLKNIEIIIIKDHAVILTVS